jgi:hypothetical protein
MTTMTTWPDMAFRPSFGRRGRVFYFYFHGSTGWHQHPRPLTERHHEQIYWGSSTRSQSWNSRQGRRFGVPNPAFLFTYPVNARSQVPGLTCATALPLCPYRKYLSAIICQFLSSNGRIRSTARAFERFRYFFSSQSGSYSAS